MDNAYHFFIKKKESGSKYILYHDQTCFIANNCSLLMGFVLLIFLVCIVQLCVFTFWIPFGDVRCSVRIGAMFGLSLPPVVCRRAHVLFTLFVFVCV